MMGRKQASWAIAAVFILSFLAAVPAALLYSVVRTKLPGVELFGLQGAWSNGSLAGITRSGQLAAQNLQFRLQPTELLMGRAAFKLTGGGDLAALDGTISRSFGATRISDMQIKGGLKRLASSVNYGFIPLEGHVEGQIDELVLVKGFIDSAAGQLDLKGLSWTLAATPMPLGDFQAKLRTTPEAIIADITSPSGPLDATGAARLFPDRRFELDILIKLKPGASEILGNYVRSLGAPDAQGFTHLKQNGKL